MSLWRQVTRGARVLFFRARADADVADEVGHYYEQSVAAHVAGGLSPEEARRAARREVGNMTVVREQVRSYGWENMVGTFVSDLRYAARRLGNNPGFTTVAALTLALGIGASTAIFSAVYPILFESLPYPHAERIVTVWYAASDHGRALQSFGNYREVAARSRTLDAIAAFKTWQPTMGGAAEPERLDGQRVSASYLRVLGVRPALGRDFDAADDRIRGPNVVVISNALWRRRLGADSTVVGRQLTLDGDAFTVLGVLPPGFESVLGPSAQIWGLLQYDEALPGSGREWGHHLQAVARLRPGVDAARATSEINQIAHAPVPEFARQPGSFMDKGMIVDALRDDITRAVRPGLLAVVGAVVLLLLIATVNVTNLLLARGAQRRGELAMRAALGAGQTRIVRQLITESLLLALVGGALGLLVAAVGVRALVALSPAGMPRLSAIGVHAPVFAFSLIASTVIGVVVGLAPALRASRHDLHGALQQGSRRTAGGHGFTRGTLVAAEVALALVLLVNAGLLLRSLDRLFSIPPGFDPAHLLTMQVQIASPQRYPKDADFNRFYAAALDVVRQVPGVRGAAFTSELPLDGADISTDEYRVQIDMGASSSSAEATELGQAAALRYAVTPGYFEAMGIPLHRGRLFDDRDVAGAAVRPLVVSESFARRAYGNTDPIGRRIRLGGPPNRPWDEIVGVVGDVKQASLAAGETEAVYATTAQWLWAETPLWLVVRAQGDAAALAPAVRKAIWSVDKDQPVIRVSTVDALVAASEAQRRFVMIVFEAFGIAALALAAIGIYGVLANSVTERVRELGVRAALGASSSDILRLVLRDGMVLTVLGIVAGLGGAAAASHAIVTLLYGVPRLDPIAYVVAIALLTAVSAVACWVPAARAAGVDPAITLRAE